MFSRDFRLIVRPRLGEDERLYNLLHKLWRMGNVTIYIDEIASLADAFKMSTLKLKDIARTGREKHVSLWCAMQRPRETPKIFLTESEVFFIFQLRSEDDRDHVRGFVGPEVDAVIPKYAFWYIRPEDTTPSLLTLDMESNQIREVETQESEVIQNVGEVR